MVMGYVDTTFLVQGQGLREVNGYQFATERSKEVVSLDQLFYIIFCCLFCFNYTCITLNRYNYLGGYSLANHLSFEYLHGS